MRNKLQIASTIALTIFTLMSCSKKTPVENPNSNVTNKNPLEIIAKLGDAESDFSIKISSILGHSLAGSNSLNKAAVFMEAASKTETNVGELIIESQTIPFISQSYFYQLDSTQKPTSFTDKNNNYVLSGSSFPSFNLNNYSAQLTDITLSGLVNNKLPANSSLTIGWTPDDELPSTSESAVLISGEDSDGNITTLTKMATDNSGSLTVTGSEMSAFSNFERIRVYYARGFSEIHDISGKTVEIGSIGFTYCTIFID